MKRRDKILYCLYVVLFAAVSNGYLMIASNPFSLFVIVPVFLYVTLFCGIFGCKTKKLSLKICCHGALSLSVFLTSAVISVIYHVLLLLTPLGWLTCAWSALTSFCAHFIFFWNGIICVYLTSVQLGINQRVTGALCGMIPIANIFALRGIIKTTTNEVAFETEKERLNEERKGDKVCKTKYPILLVHGVFFRDTALFNYWGRIPAELKRNGAKIYYGNHASAASVADSAKELAVRIRYVAERFGEGKVNVIAHSKGGLDCRYAIEKEGIADCIASLTTINTPHRGCLFADYLLNKIPEEVKDKAASAYNAALGKLGDDRPDFIAAVSDLTASACERLNEELPVPEGIFCQSVGSTMEKAAGGKFPLNYSYHLVKYFDGKNDGLVSEDSFAWGEKYTHLNNGEKRGISHGDMIDLNRENIDGFDVREFYVQLVNDLKKREL